MKNKELPQDIIDVVKLRCEEQWRIFNAENELGKFNDVEGFNWDETKEKWDVWNEVNQGNYKPFYKLHSKWQPKFGEMVLVSDENDIKTADKRIFLIEIPQAKCKYVCSFDIDGKNFKKGLDVATNNWQYMWQIPQETEQEIKIKEFEAKIAEMQKELEELKKLK